MFSVVVYTRDDLVDLLDMPEELRSMHLRVHVRGATLEFPDGLDEIQLNRLVDYSSALDFTGTRSH